MLIKSKYLGNFMGDLSGGSEASISESIIICTAFPWR